MKSEEVVRVIAERDGLTESGPYLLDVKEWSYRKNGKRVDRPDYLHSRDALFPVIGKLSEKEWGTLDRLITIKWTKSDEAFHAQSSSDGRRWLLTLPPETLAPLVARAIVESK